MRPLPGAGPRTVAVFDAESLSHVDATGVESPPNLTELPRCARNRSPSFVAAFHGPTGRLKEAGVLDLVGEDHIYPTVHAAVQAAPVEA